MKSFSLLFCLLAGLHVGAQSYQANNEVLLVLKDRNLYKGYSSKSLFSKINLETSEFVIQVDFNTFRTEDTANKVSLLKIFPVESSPFLSFKGTVPFNNLDKSSSLTQTVPVIGSVMIASQSYQITLPVDFEFMDKQLMFRASFNLDLSRLNITLPSEYRNTILPVMVVRVDNGHFIRKE